MASTTTVSIEKSNVDLVKREIIGKPYTIGTFYEKAAKEKIERDKLKQRG